MVNSNHSERYILTYFDPWISDNLPTHLSFCYGGFCTYFEEADTTGDKKVNAQYHSVNIISRIRLDLRTNKLLEIW